MDGMPGTSVACARRAWGTLADTAGPGVMDLRSSSCLRRVTMVALFPVLVQASARQRGCNEMWTYWERPRLLASFLSSLTVSDSHAFVRRTVETKLRLCVARRRAMRSILGQGGLARAERGWTRWSPRTPVMSRMETMDVGGHCVEQRAGRRARRAAIISICVIQQIKKYLSSPASCLSASCF